MKKVSFNIGHFCKKYGDKNALDFAKSIGADCVDFFGNISEFLNGYEDVIREIRRLVR